jgi:hypothetical protein
MRKHVVPALLVIVALIGVGVIGFGYARSHHLLGLGNQPTYDPTYAPGQAVPSAAATPSGAPTQQGPLAGSHLTVTDPQGEAIVDTALDDKYVEMDGTGQVSPGPYPAFYYQSRASELPITGQPEGTWVIAGHSGEPGTNQKFTPLLDLLGKDEATLNGYRAALNAPIGASQWMVDSVVRTGKLAFTGKYAANIRDRVILVLCYITEDGKLDETKSVFVTLIHPPPAI